MANVCCRIHPSLLLPLYHRHSTSISRRRFHLPSSPPSIQICRCRPWGSNAESYNTRNFNFNSADYNDEDQAGDDDIEQWVDALEDYIDSIWIFKVFRSYGWMLPIIIISLLLANGPKAFLLALALPLGQSTFAFAYQRMQQEMKGKHKPRTKPKNKTNKGKSWARSSRNATLEREEVEEVWVRGKGLRKKKKGYQSRNDVNNRADGSASAFGGWDELDAQIEPNVKKSSGFENGKLRRKRNVSDAPLLLRVLISIFPFLKFME